jgi:flagellar basal-body rod protein FlgF
MDRLIYTAMTGAKHVMEQQANASHNLANVSTNGFRAALDSFRAVPVVGEGLPTRTMVVDATIGSDFRPGPLQQTGRVLDVALEGKGWLAVQTADGGEAFTRNGSLKVSESGVLQTSGGLDVLGDGGPISIPPGVAVSIARDGTVSSVSTITTPATVSPLGRLKLVNPPEDSIVRGDDGLFRTRDGVAPDADATVVVAGGALEGSNVSMVEAMVNMINLSRQFEMHMSLLKNAESNDSKASQLVALG